MIEDILKNMLNQENTYSLAMIFPLVLQLFGLVSAVLIDSFISKKHKRVMLVIALLAFSLIVQNYVENMLAAGSLKWLARTLASIWGYSVRPVILVLFLYIISPDRRYGAIWILVGVNTAVHLTALFSPICFMIDEQNHYQGGPLHAFCYYVSLFLLCCFVYLTIYEYRHVKKWEMLIPIVNVLLVVVGIILDRNVGYSDQPVTFLTDAVVSGCIFSYIWLHQQFVREHESDLAAQQRIKIMVTQIQPHFLYNTIVSEAEGLTAFYHGGL